MVAIALLERNKSLSPEDAITFIRKKRKGAINTKQVKFLQNYKRKGGNACKVQ
jgi:protein tyrosine phosphatase type IVA